MGGLGERYHPTPERAIFNGKNIISIQTTFSLSNRVTKQEDSSRRSRIAPLYPSSMYFLTSTSPRIGKWFNFWRGFGGAVGRTSHDGRSSQLRRSMQSQKSSSIRGVRTSPRHAARLLSRTSADRLA